MEIHFEKERDTKNTVRFTEDVEEGGTPVIGTLYVQKDRAAELGDSVLVTLEAA